MTSNEKIVWPKISVITPSLNQAQFLEQCIRSVLEQDYPNLEYLIIDGGSTDQSLEIIRRYDQALSYWISEPDSGQADGINKGFRHATGDLIAWLNSDDFYMPGALKTIAEAYLANPDAPFFFGNGWRVDIYGRRKSQFYPDNQFGFSRPALVYGLNFILQPAAFINVAALRKIGELDTHLSYGFDTDLWIRLSSLGEPQQIMREIAASREYLETKTSTGLFRRLEELRLISEKYSEAPATPGYVCYFLDTLHEIVRQNPKIFPDNYSRDIEAFWKTTTRLFCYFGAQPNGIPFNHHRIGIELRNVTYGESGGISFHLTGLLSALFRNFPDNEYYIFGTIFNQNLIPATGPNIHQYSLPLSSFFQDMDLILGKEKISILFRSYPTPDQINFPLQRQIFYIPDIQHDFFPEFFSQIILEARQVAFRLAMRGAAAIGTLTNYTRRTIQEHPENSCDDIFLLPPALSIVGSDPQENQLRPDEIELLPQKEFFFFPGNLWPHKNHRRTLQAFGKFLNQTGLPMELILTGHPDGWEALRAEFPDLPVRHLGFVRVALVKYLYQHAQALAFFSLYEGFGMPLLEAFHANTPVICSNTTSLPEVGGEAVMTCDPLDIDAMAELMVRIVQDQALRDRLVANGQRQLNLYSWESSAQSLMDAIQRVRNLGPAKRTASKPIQQPVKEKFPLVSVVTPSYNQGRFLRRTIESVLNQTYPNIEYVVIDGGSTDNSAEILQSYGDRFTWVSERDDGQTDAINKGFARCHGEILAYLNSDDTLLPQAIETVVRYFGDRPDVDLFYGEAYYTDEGDNITGKYATAEYTFERLVWDNCICQPAAFWRKRIADRVGPFNTQLQFAMDHEYWMRVDRAGGKIVHVPDILACSRLHIETKTLTSRSKIIKEIFRISQQQAGYVSLSYFITLWHDRIWTQPHSPYRLFRIVPGSFRYMARLHEAVYNRRWPPALKPGAFTSRFTSSLRRYLADNLDFLRPVVRSRRAKKILVSSTKPVFGMYPNNTLGPVFQVYIKRKQPGQKFFMDGTPITDSQLTIRVDRKILSILQLVAGQAARIDIDVFAGQTVTFEFNNSPKDQNGFYSTYLVKSTNLFTEADAAIP